jgi:hypothetical protein
MHSEVTRATGSMATETAESGNGGPNWTSGGGTCRTTEAASGVLPVASVILKTFLSKRAPPR